MASKFTVMSGSDFKGTPVEEAFQTLLDMGWRKSDFAITGSSALYLLSQTALSRGDNALITRAPHDIDIIVVGDAKRHATDIGMRIESNIGRGYLINLKLAENKSDLLDITTDWPVGARIKTVRDLVEHTELVNGIQVVNPNLVLELKDKFNRVKDRPDIVSAERGLHSNRTLVGLKTPGFRG